MTTAAESPFDRAIAIAEAAHATQTDKLGAPYIDHVRRVIDRAGWLAPDELAELCRTAAALHDLVEDTDWTLDDLTAQGFDPRVVAAVDSVTKREGEDYFDMVRRSAADPVGRWVKLADNLDNADPERAAQLPDDVRARLAEKYAAARRILAEAGAVTPSDWS